MAVVRCDKGLHFYDNDKFSYCPHCNKGNSSKNAWTDMGGDDINSQVTQSVKEIDPNVIETVGVINEINMQAPPISPLIFDEKIRVDDIDDDVTQAYYSASKGNDFITGWLVCVSGPEKGRDYRIFHGVNKMGRGDNLDIVVKGDKEISRDKVCSVVYDDRSNKFYIIPYTNGMVYLNDTHILEATEMVTGDTISMGNSQFEFIAFCKGERKWNQTQKEM